MSIAAVVLAAGASRRLGRPKQQVVLAGETLLTRVVRVTQAAGLSPIIVVARTSAEVGLSALGVQIVVNESADEGIASSIRLGIETIQLHQATGAVLIACDQPALSSGHLRALAAAPAKLAASGYADTVGIPAYFPADFFPDLLRLRGDTGARSILKDARVVQAEELKFDVDTEDDLIAVRAFLNRPGTLAKQG